MKVIDPIRLSVNFVGAESSKLEESFITCWECGLTDLDFILKAGKQLQPRTVQHSI